jgi:hypothetical protein
MKNGHKKGPLYASLASVNAEVVDSLPIAFFAALSTISQILNGELEEEMIIT